MFRKMFVLVMAVLAVFMLAGCGDSTDTVSSVSDALSPEQEKAQSMDWAHEYGETIFVFNKVSSNTYALCEGNTYIATLDAGEYNRIKLSSQEALNLTLCKYSPDTGNYSQVQDISGVSPGDYLEWDANGSLAWTSYVP